MSKQPHLPPRCPYQKKTITHPIDDPLSPTLCIDNKLYPPRHHKSRSQSSIFEEQLPWLDDLLDDTNSASNVMSHRHAASDSETLLLGLLKLPSLNTVNDEENSGSSGTYSGLESACIYGPNSPRTKSKLNLEENAVVSALSEYASQNLMQHLDGGLCISGMAEFDSTQEACGFAGEVNAEMKPVKRHFGQRSRVRKLQYIAELERTVEVLQTLESQLSVRVASLLQQRVALSMENIELKQQVARLKQEKLIVDGEYQSLRKEIERLKLRVAYFPNSRVSTNFRSTVDEETNSEAIWQMLNMGKLDLNGGS